MSSKTLNIKKRTVKIVNQLLGVDMFSIRRIGNKYKLVFGNIYSLNSDVSADKIVIYNKREKIESNIDLIIDIEKLRKEPNRKVYRDEIIDLIENNEYKRKLYKIHDIKNDLFLSKYWVDMLGDVKVSLTEYYVYNGIICSKEDIWITDLEEKAERVMDKIALNHYWKLSLVLIHR